MSELTTSQIIKWALAVFVIVVVIVGIALFFKDKFLSFFQNLPGAGNQTIKLFISLIK